MILSRYTVKNIAGEVQIPDESVFTLPEKVLQFGTGVLLRALPDYFIDKANRQGKFNGRIVVVKSTSKGDTSAFDRQDGLYTVCVRGVEEENAVVENIVNASISRVLNAATEWEQVLECAHNSALQVVISNTTEIGITLVHDDIRHHPPVSFPGKLLAFLYERYQAFHGSDRSGLVIVPTELVPDNGKKLESIVMELAHLNGLEDGFIEWLENSNHFCNSLVDRIVPGSPDQETLGQLESGLGYSDQLLTVAEAYRLWAIEGDEKVRSVLGFADADNGVVITPDIGLYRELKLRMLNGTHTLACGVAFFAGCETVRQAMEDELVGNYITSLMQNEIAPSIPYPVPLAEAHQYGGRVLDRFRNPHIRHQWLSITMNYSSKMKTRCIPLILRHYEITDSVPEAMALGFASYIYFMKGVTRKGDQYFGEKDGESYPVQDELAALFYKRWTGLSLAVLVNEVLADNYWEAELLALPGFRQSVEQKLIRIMEEGIREALTALPNKKVVAA
jgi:tagaturonate reductase